MTKHLYSLEGFVKRHPDGYGFLIPIETDKKDVFLPKRTMEGIMTNDKVLVKVFQEVKNTDTHGEIIKVIERSAKKIVGVFTILNDKTGVLVDQENHWGENLKILMEDSKGAENRNWVEVEVKNYPGHPAGFSGVVTNVIGHMNDPLFDTKRAIATHMIPEGFSDDTLKELKKIDHKVNLDPKSKRKDLRDLNFITIDGVTAKDFDDAVYIETTGKGFHLYVAIADVSHYVKPGSALDSDAYEKGNSSYFPMYVVPMLPEVLSNELCSLKPNVDRYAMVADIHMNFRGEIESKDFYEAIICSKSRVTYAEAQEIIDGNPIEKHAHVEKDILRAYDLSKILISRRSGRGSLDLDIPETQVILDESGTPVDIVKSERVFAHRLIEELMLAANISVAQFFVEKEIDAIFRNHENPDPDRLQTLQSFLETFGEKITLSGGKMQKKMTKALQKFKGKVEGQILSQLTLRSMKQAQYSADNKGHFGLNFDEYTHFTSPIRRYPDLIVHRLLKAQVYGPKYGYQFEKLEDLETAGTNCSATEQRSVKAERLLVSIKKARFAQKLVGEELPGTISSIAKFGIFVNLRQYDVDGLVRISDLGADYFIFEEETLQLRGERSGYIYKMGQEVNVIVAAANPDLGQIDFSLVSDAFTPSKSKRKTSIRKKKKKVHSESSDSKSENTKGKKKSKKFGRKKTPNIGKKKTSSPNSGSSTKKKKSNKKRRRK
ncbi:MAG: ribonuclease R [Bdellovibrionales bacterium]